jgi:hypothetical protein
MAAAVAAVRSFKPAPLAAETLGMMPAGAAGGMKGACGVDMTAALTIGGALGLATAGLDILLMGTVLAGLRAGSSRVTPSGALSEAANMTPVLEMDLSSKLSATSVPTR